jgi:hypothetical protein
MLDAASSGVVCAKQGPAEMIDRSWPLGPLLFQPAAIHCDLYE